MTTGYGKMQKLHGDVGRGGGGGGGGGGVGGGGVKGEQ